MVPHLPGQAKEPQALFQVHGLGRPALGQGGALRLFVLAQLDEGTKSARLQEDRLAGLGIRPQFAVSRRSVALLGGGAEFPRVPALWIVRAADEGLEAAWLQGKLTCPALGAGAAAGGGEQEGAQGGVEGLDDIAGRPLQDLLGGPVEVAPELPQEGLPVQVPCGHLVQLFLQRRREVVLDIAVEEGLEEDGDQAALVLRDEAVLLHPDIAAIPQDREDRGIGRGATDAELFHLPHQARLGIARRRLGEVLVGARDPDLGAGGLPERRQASAILVLGIIPAFLVDLQVAVKQDDLSCGPQSGAAIGRRQVDGGPLDPGGLHLGGQHALPDQLVEPTKVALEPERPGVAGQAGRTDRLVGLLGVPGLGPVLAGGLWNVVGTEEA